jgi:8-oxo-dGTP pyrophosphatase MutT (NUDIX family)
MIEEGESPIEALIREIKEELELDLEEHLVEKIYERIDDKYELHFFKSSIIGNFSDLKLNEGQEMKLFSIEEISKLDNIVPNLNRLFENLHNLPK